MNRKITTRDDLTAYVWESLTGDPNPYAINVDDVVTEVYKAAEVEYGVTTTDDIEERLDMDAFYAIVAKHTSAADEEQQ
jgi:hypothetical protein